jgi:hypothetical protein
VDHGEALAAISDRLCRPLPPALDSALGEHLLGCEPCRAEAAAWEPTRAWLAHEEHAGVSSATGMKAQVAARLLPRLRAATLARPARKRRQRTLRALVVGSVGLAAAALVALFVMPGKRGPFQAPPVAYQAQPAAPQPTTAAPLPAAAAARMAALVSDVRSTDGGRARAIALANASVDRADPPEAIVAALVRTLRGDRNPGVRLRAAEALARLSPTAPIRQAFIRALERDANPAVRIVAVEALGRAARDFDPDSIEALRERARDESESTHVRTRVARALETIKL